MADRYWVQGGTGNWNSITNWSASSGGASGASVPTSSDNVYFNASSFTAEGQSVTINASASCADMVWTNAAYNPTLFHSDNLNIYGSLTFISTMQYSASTAYIYFRTSATSKTVQTAGLTLENVYFDGLGTDTWTLSAGVTATNNMRLWGGTLDLNDFDVTVGNRFYTSGTTQTRVLTLGTGTLTCGSFDCSTATGLTINEETSTIVCTGSSGYTYFYSKSGTTETFYNVEMQASGSISGSFTVTNLTLSAGYTYTLESGQTITLSSFDIEGTSNNRIVLQTTSIATQAIISDTTGTNTFYYCDIENIKCQGGATFNAVFCLDNDGNSGITFTTTYYVPEILQFAERYFPNTGISQSDMVLDLNMIHKQVYNKIIRLKNIYKNSMVESIEDQKSVTLPSDCLPENILYVTVSSDVTGSIDDDTTYQEYQLASLKQDISDGYWYKVTSSTTIDLTVDGEALDADDYNINFYYYPNPAEIIGLTSTISLDREYHDILKYGLVQAMATQGHNPDTDMANYYQAKFDERMSAIEKQMGERRAFAPLEYEQLESRW